MKDYSPKVINFSNNTSRIDKLIIGVQLVCEQIKNGEKYELVVITRPDIYFLKSFENIDPTKLNMVSILENDNLTDDNLYIFPASFIQKFLNTLYEIRQTDNPPNRLVMHRSLQKLSSNFNIKYLCNERTNVNNLSFFKIRNNVVNEFLISELQHSLGFLYNIRDFNASVIKNGNSLQLRKLVKECSGNIWIGNNIHNVGKYMLTFDMYTDVRIDNFKFVKLHKPIRFYDTPTINPNEKKQISIVIDTYEKDDFLCLIFDEFVGLINVTFDNILITPITNKQNGLIIKNFNDCNIPIDTNGVCVYQTNLDELEIVKPVTETSHSFRWFGYDVKPEYQNMLMSFEIKFISDIPSVNDKFAIKTHSPFEYYNLWLAKCEKNKFVKIDIPLYVNLAQQLIIFIMDECVSDIHFVLRNVSFSKIDYNIPHSNLRVALLMAGEMRNYDNADLLKLNENNFFSKYKCDLFVSTWDKKGYSPYHGTVQIKNYSNEKLTNNDILKTYKNVKNINIENFDEWLLKLPQTYREIYDKGFQIVGTNKIVKCTVFPQLYKIWNANEMKKTYEKSNNFKYDMVIRIRSDMGFVEDIPDAYLYDFLKTHESLNKIWTINPPKIFYPKRIYDIFFYGDSQTMNKLCDSWNHILDIIGHPYDNGLLKVDSCRSLYVGCLMNNINVIDILHCFGDIYRDETISDYIDKILHVFN
jgi:hypothetical protein